MYQRLKQAELDIVSLPNVYPPSEDTFLLCDSIELGSDDSFLEVGSGTGLIALTAAKIARRTVAIDISFQAVRNTYLNAQRNHLTECVVIQSDLMSALHPCVKFSVIAFNPPYLPADDVVTTLDHALVGGQSGVEIVNRFIAEAVGHIADGGSIYVVVSSLTSVDEVLRKMQYYSISPEIIAQSSFFFERIYVLRGVAKHPSKPF